MKKPLVLVLAVLNLALIVLFYLSIDIGESNEQLDVSDTENQVSSATKPRRVSGRIPPFSPVSDNARDPIGRSEYIQEGVDSHKCTGQVRSAIIKKGIHGAKIYAYFVPLGGGQRARVQAVLVSTALSDESGNYCLSIPRRQQNFELSISLFHPQFLRPDFQTLQIGSGADSSHELRVDFELEQGNTITGTVKRADGDRVSGIRLIATTAEIGCDEDAVFKSGFTTYTTHMQTAPPGSSYSESRTVTDENGEFVFHGTRSNFNYFIASLDYELVIVPRHSFAGGTADIVLEMEKASGIRGTIRDSKTKELIKRSLAMVEVRDGQRKINRGGTCLDGELDLSWRKWSDSIVNVRITVSAKGYESQTEEIRWNPRDGRSEINILLKQRERVRINLRCKDSTGNYFVGPLRVDYEQHDGGVKGVIRVPATETPETRTIGIPQGKWALKVSPDHFAGAMSASRFTIDTARASVNGIDCVLGPTATLSINSMNTHGKFEFVAIGDSFSGRTDLSSSKVTYYGFPVGIWNLEIWSTNTRMGQRTIEVLPGENTAITFP